MTSEWEKWKDLEDTGWTKGEVEHKDGYDIHTQHNIKNSMEPKSIEESIREAKKSHRKIFEDNRATDGFPPTALIINPDGLWTCVCCPDWGDMREAGRKELHRIALRERAVALVWGSDSFYLERPSADVADGNWRDLERPSEAPDRREAFILTTVWPDGSAEMEMYPYRVEDGKLVWLEGEKIPPGTKVEQRICPAWAPSTGTVQ